MEINRARSKQIPCVFNQTECIPVMWLVVTPHRWPQLGHHITNDLSATNLSSLHFSTPHQMSRYDPARDCFTTDPVPAPSHQGVPSSDAISSESGASSSPQSTPQKPASSSHHQTSSPPVPRRSPSSSPNLKRKASPEPPRAAPADGKPIPYNAANLPRIKKRKPADNEPAPPKYRYRSPPPPIIPKDKEPTPPPRAGSPPRQRKKPGAASRLSEAEKLALRAAQEKREQDERRAKEDAERRVASEAEKRRVQEEVRSHYNQKRELGREWRQTSSRIKGLRNFNNWVKSTLIQKFSPNEGYDPRHPSRDPNDHLVVLDMGCGKGGDLLKWKSAPQEVGFYLGVDCADVSIAHARDRYDGMLRDARRQRRHVFRADFHAMDCWTNSISQLEIARRIGVDVEVGPGTNSRWSNGGGFDVVTMMFCMHYAFENEEKCRIMMKNVAGALKKGGRFIGTIPSSDVISARVSGQDKRDTLPEDEPEHGVQEWGNSIYRIRFADPPPRSGKFRPSWGWKYNFFLEEAVEEVPEYVVPFEAFRGIAEDYGLTLEYKKHFHDVWREEKDDPELRSLSERMGVRNRQTGEMVMGDEEWEACGMLSLSEMMWGVLTSVFRGLFGFLVHEGVRCRWVGDVDGRVFCVLACVITVERPVLYFKHCS